ncbi:cell division protein ZapA [Alkanindiges illinoisensis]|uniref:Cell division protein ZapA n=1 Tax=Alkanindiges illinoisensis TaxID=197183 RepID=A0A4Y7XEF4_9GAMM|nr:cell division protein ZapA [Alkanindiges illinoisensis]TEU30029.1 cell division protein ZapA [Alkanindiges illinoisensis]
MMTVDVRILDRSYKLACEPSEEEQLQKAVNLLEQKLQDMRRSMPRLESERVAVLTALSLAQEVLSLNKDLQEQTHCQRLIKQMINDAEKSLAQLG